MQMKTNMYGEKYMCNSLKNRPRAAISITPNSYSFTNQISPSQDNLTLPEMNNTKMHLSCKIQKNNDVIEVDKQFSDLHLDIANE